MGCDCWPPYNVQGHLLTEAIIMCSTARGFKKAPEMTLVVAASQTHCTNHAAKLLSGKINRLLALSK